LKQRRFADVVDNLCFNPPYFSAALNTNSNPLNPKWILSPSRSSRDSPAGTSTPLMKVPLVVFSGRIEIPSLVCSTTACRREMTILASHSARSMSGAPPLPERPSVTGDLLSRKTSPRGPSPGAAAGGSPARVRPIPLVVGAHYFDAICISLGNPNSCAYQPGSPQSGTR
jgi:hypothetical protein